MANGEIGSYVHTYIRISEMLLHVCIYMYIILWCPGGVARSQGQVQGGQQWAAEGERESEAGQRLSWEGTEHPTQAAHYSGTAQELQVSHQLGQSAQSTGYVVYSVSYCVYCCMCIHVSLLLMWKLTSWVLSWQAMIFALWAYGYAMAYVGYSLIMECELGFIHGLVHFKLSGETLSFFFVVSTRNILFFD